MKITKKCTPDLFQLILEGKKTADLRLADWEIKEGDILELKEYNQNTNQYTGRVIEKKVTHVLKTKNLNFFSKEDTDKHGFQMISFVKYTIPNTKSFINDL